MFGLFIIIIFWVVIISIAKKSNKSGTKKGNFGTQKNTDYNTLYTYANKAEKSATSQARGATANSSGGSFAGNTAKSNQNPSAESSTTEMLRQKALQDEKEHRMENQKQKMENKRHYGDLNYAGRYLLGDPIPQSRKLIVCQYCSAENLIPQNDNPGKYHCYFCREKL